jgi:hypothetical protein
MPNFSKQLALQAAYDPSKVFEPLLLGQLISGGSLGYGPQCDVKRQCYCTQDAHCAAGHACVASKAFPEYRVCKPAGGFIVKLG